MKFNYPFTAIVGQEKLKQALLLCAINPAIGGLLIQGDKGTAKSTAARALAEVVEAPFVNLPLGATEERILGSLDLEAVLVEKKKKFQPGLLAAVHQGILYIDEVNLLSDHLVDVLLDVAASGENIIEREGLSMSHPSRFTLIGTMNPEEGQLRPQFLDRFGLMVHVEAPADVMERTEVVRRRIAFDKDEAAFIKQWESQQQNLRLKVEAAKELLSKVHLNDELLTLISQMSTDLNVRSLRADIVMYKTAITLAALDRRTAVTADDVIAAAELALAHRSRKKSNSEPPSSQKRQEPPTPPKEPSQDKDEKKNSSSNNSPDVKNNDDLFNEGEGLEEDHSGKGNQKEPAPEQIFEAVVPLTFPEIESFMAESGQDQQAGRRNTANFNKGAHVRSEPAKSTADIAIEATVIHAVLRNHDQLNISIDDLQQKKRSGKVSNLILFVVDASGSMAANKRMEAVKGTVLSLLTDAYQKRDTVGVIAFRGIEASVLLNPTQSIELAEEAMRSLPTGGRTPLPHALQTAINLLHQYDKKGYKPILVILTDGKANVALSGGGDPWNQTLTLAGQLQHLNIKSLVLNTESDYFNLGKAEELAKALGGQYQSINDISEAHLTPLINQIL